MECRSCKYYERSFFTVCDNPECGYYGEGTHYDDGCTSWEPTDEEEEGEE